MLRRWELKNTCQKSNQNCKLLKEISDFENNKIADEEYNINPSPDVIYQCNLLYLSKLCELIADKFNKEYEWNN